jgi:hypothetical protein
MPVSGHDILFKKSFSLYYKLVGIPPPLEKSSRFGSKNNLTGKFSSHKILLKTGIGNKILNCFHGRKVQKNYAH